MTKPSIYTLSASLVLLCGQALTHAAPTGINITATIQDVEGSYIGDFVALESASGTFIYDTDEANAGPGSITTPSNNPGHEFSSFYEFLDAPYSATLSTTATPEFFTSNDYFAVVVNDNLPLTSEEIGGVLPDGNYDWIELLGSTALGICLIPGGECTPDEISPADGEEWTLAIFAQDNNWFTDGSLIPDSLPAVYTALLVGFEFDVTGNEVGVVFATIDSLTTFTPQLAGDLDGDGFVGITDLNLVLSNWNLSVPPADPLADPSGDNFVGIEDLNTVLGNWNAGTPPTAANSTVPEPAALILFAFGGLSLLRRRTPERP